MLEKISLLFIYGFRGLIHAISFMLLAALLLSGILQPSIIPGTFEMLSTYVANGITLLGGGFFIASLIVWIDTWISDYRSDYLPNWVRREMY